jgi:acetyl-CoA carboxylase biotin carboxylase subunit
MFKKVLVANRGEIAVRIMQTYKSMGIFTIGVYSQADSDALHVKLADDACLLGGPCESYLNIDKILEIAILCEAEAIHPSYGPFSENAEFARRCEELGIIFIGPSLVLQEAVAHPAFRSGEVL